MMLVTLATFLHFNWNTIKIRFSEMFLAKSYKKSQYLCPKCGSDDWKFPNPIKPAEKMINTPHMVNNFLECKNCGYIGIFFAVDDAKKIQKEFKHDSNKKQNQKYISNSLNFLGWSLVAITFILIFLAPSLLFGVIIGVIGFGMAKKLGTSKNH